MNRINRIGKLTVKYFYPAHLVHPVKFPPMFHSSEICPKLILIL
jgi:hypothetical protein